MEDALYTTPSNTDKERGEGSRTPRHVKAYVHSKTTVAKTNPTSRDPLIWAKSKSQPQKETICERGEADVCITNPKVA
jgi:hypothetical protein